MTNERCLICGETEGGGDHLVPGGPHTFLPPSKVRQIFQVTGWSRVPGDRAYAEGSTATEAIALVRQDLLDNHHVADMNERPASDTWTAEPLPRPFVTVVYQD